MPAVEYHVPVGHAVEPCESVFGDYDGEPFVLHLLDHGAHVRDGVRVEIAGRLIQYHEPGPQHGGRRHGDALLLAARQVEDAAMQQMPNAKALSHGRDTTIDVLGRQPYVFGREGELVGDVRVEILGFRVLEHAADQRGEPVDRHGLHIQPARGLVAGERTMEE